MNIMTITRKEGLTNCQALVTYLVIVLGACYFYFGNSDSAPTKEDGGTAPNEGKVTEAKTENGTTLRVLPVEFHARLGENGNPVSEEQRKRVSDLANADVIPYLETPSKGSYIEIDKAWPIYLKKGAQALRDTKAATVHFPLMGTYLKIDKFFPVAKIYKDDGVDLSKEVFIEIPYKGTDGATIILPKHFANEILAAAKEAGVIPVFAWGVRDYNLQAVMWARTLLRCQADPAKYTGHFWASADKCEIYIKREVGKPKKFSFTHMWSADIVNWRAFKDQLWAHKFVVGCNSPLVEHDLRHATWNLPQNDSTLSKAKCEGVTTWRSIKKLNPFK